MSENNYSAMMMKSSTSASDDINNIVSPGIYIIPPANASSPAPDGGVLTVHAGTPAIRTFTSYSMGFFTSSIDSITSKWSEWKWMLSGIKSFTSSGRFIVPDGVTELFISAVAGGGGGGSGGGGDSSYFGGGGGSGGAGESIIKRKFTVVPGSIIDLIIGSGGTGSIASVATGSHPTSGGDTIIGALLTLRGGKAGINAANGQTTAPGGNGGDGYPAGSFGGDGNLTIGSGNGSPGASSPFGGGGGGGRAGTDRGTDGTAGFGYGSGGGSGGGKYGTGPTTAPGGNGGDGAPGIVIIEW